MNVLEYLNRYKNLQNEIKHDKLLRLVYRDVRNPKYAIEMKKSEELFETQQQIDRENDLKTALALFPK